MRSLSREAGGLVVGGKGRPFGFALWTSSLNHVKFRAPFGGFFGPDGSFKELNEILKGFSQHFAPVANTALALAHAFIARDKQRFGLHVFSFAQQRGAEEHSGIVSVPGVGTIFFAHREAFPIKRFGFRKPLLTAERGRQSTKCDLHILPV